MSETYCVIGAGPAGLLAARSLKNAGIPYEQFEKNDDVGGIWEINNEWSPMYESAHFISSKTVSNLPGYSMPADYPDYPNHRLILKYLKSFAKDNDLYDKITFSLGVSKTEKDGDFWHVTFADGTTKKYAGLFICSGNTWDPNLPKYEGTFAGETMHSVRYKTPDIFKNKRVLVVGGGNSGCDIACDAATNAKSTSISLRRGYHFIPKFMFGMATDAYAEKYKSPLWVQRPFFTLMLKFLVGDLTKFGLQKPDHRILDSHPILNTQLLHHLGHGDISAKVDIEKFEGKKVVFTDGSSDEFDLIVFATGYKVTFPFIDRSHFNWIAKYPDLFLSAIHREYDNVCILGLHQTDGGAYDFFAVQANMMCNFILDQKNNPEKADRFRTLKKTYPKLTGGINYVKSDRHATYVHKDTFKKYCNKIMKKFGWKSFGFTNV